MAELKIGLAPRKTSYYDKNARVYMTLENPVQIITYNELDAEGTLLKLQNITHAILCSIPALVLYDGQLPKESIEAWEKKYLSPFNGPTKRNIVSNGEIIGTVDIKDPLRSGVDLEGRKIEPNRAFDRSEKFKPDVVRKSTKDATVETPELLKEDVEDQVEKETKPQQRKKTTTTAADK